MDPSNIKLSDLYTDHYEALKETIVFPNGKMQAVVYPSVNYTGDTNDDILSQIEQYVYNNIEIQHLSDVPQILDWEKSNESNGFEHNADPNAPVRNASKRKTVSDIHTPIYLTVPISASIGVNRLIAKLGDTTTSTSNPVHVQVVSFKPTKDDIIIQDVGSYTNHALVRTIRYKEGINPQSLKLVKCLTYKGILFDKSFGCWCSMFKGDKGNKAAGFFIKDANNTKMAASGATYTCSNCDFNEWSYPPAYQLWTNGDGWSGPSSVDPENLKKAWNYGIAIVRTSIDFLKVMKNPGGSYHEDEMFQNPFILQDNFGNNLEVTIWWGDKNADWWGNWGISNVVNADI